MARQQQNLTVIEEESEWHSRGVKKNWIKKMVKVTFWRESLWQPEKFQNGEKLETVKDHAQETIQ